MREILFRGKTINSGEWIYGYYWTNEIGNHFIKAIKSKDDNFVSNPTTNDFEVNPETVGQYTGLKDKNGKKIFEGDIVECVHWFFDGNEVDELFTATVGFRDASFTLENIDSKYYANYTGGNKGEGICWIGNIYYHDQDYEVIGNTHDNPKLLEEEQK